MGQTRDAVHDRNSLGACEWCSSENAVRRRRHLDNDFAKIVSYPDGEDDTPGYELMHD
jgi:hypothetical protein